MGEDIITNTMQRFWKDSEKTHQISIEVRQIEINPTLLDSWEGFDSRTRLPMSLGPPVLSAGLSVKKVRLLKCKLNPDFL